VPVKELKADVQRDTIVLWSGPGYHVVHYPLRHGAEFNIVAVFRTSTHTEKSDPTTYRAELEETYRNAHPYIARIKRDDGSSLAPLCC
jgi:3-hydroxybenzoate 6-monooxygenase